MESDIVLYERISIYIYIFRYIQALLVTYKTLVSDTDLHRT